jgi:hypothetical protein
MAQQQRSNFQMPLDYIDVATRIVEFREKYPQGSLQQVSVDFREFGGQAWVIYTAAAYRSPDDVRPGMGTAWEPVPGKTPYTRDSELQNAETAAWGRAIVAALAADTRKGVASAEEVRNRREAEEQEPQQRRAPREASRRQTPSTDVARVKTAIAAYFPGKTPSQIAAEVSDRLGKPAAEATVEELQGLLAELERGAAA